MEDLKKKRLSNLLTQELPKYKGSMAALAKAIGINPNTFRTYMNEVSFPDVENLLKIAHFLTISVDELNQRLESQPKAVRETVAKHYQVNTNTTAEDILPLTRQLSTAEQVKLAKMLLEQALSSDERFLIAS